MSRAHPRPPYDSQQSSSGISSMDDQPPSKRARFDSFETHLATERSLDTAGGVGGGGGAGPDPLPIALPQNARGVEKYRLKAAGTTFIRDGQGTGIDAESAWSRFPWENIQLFIADWTSIELQQRFLYWKATKITICFKNPLCIQEIGNATSGLVTAGQNLHAQLFGYMDDMYLLGVNNPIKAMVELDVNKLVQSWKNNGYSAGLPISLPEQNVSTNMALFQNNWPDVQNCGMGPGHTLGFAWNIHSPYWRSTAVFGCAMQTAAGTPIFVTANSRWDERLGMISSIQTPTANVTVPTAFYTNVNATAPEATPLARAQWQSKALSEQNLQIPYMDPSPIPGIYFQLQPQLGAISTGVSSSVCQVQWEMTIDIVCTGKLPRTSNDQPTLFDPRNANAINLGKQGVHARTIPLFNDVQIASIDY